MLSVTIVIFIFMDRMDKMVERVTQNHLLAAAQAASAYLTVEELDLFHTADDMDRPEWDAIRKRLQVFAEEYNVLFVYYWRDYGDGRIQYIIDNDEDVEYMVTPEMFFYIDGDPITAETVPLVMSGGIWTSDLGAYTTSWYHLISAIAPVFNDDGTVYCAAGVDLSDEIILAQRNNVSSIRYVMICSLFLSILLGSLGMWAHRRKAIESENASIAKSEFLTIMSHEIRTPLNAVIGFSEIELLGELPEFSKENIRQIHQSGMTLLGIIGDILDISKIEAGRFELEPVEYDIASLLSETLDLNLIRIGSKPINFTLEVESDLPQYLVGDALRIKQVLSNLLSNAIKYTNEGAVSLKVEWDNIKALSNESEEVLLRFIVRDTGIGIRKEDMGKLYESYTQLDSGVNRRLDGTGLGLTITKTIVEMMDGKISASSEYGKGSVFTAEIVQKLLVRDSFEHACIGEETAEDLRNFRHKTVRSDEQVERPWLPNGRVLVVDDNVANLRVARGMLIPYGISADTAISGQEAIEKVRLSVSSGSDKSRYDLIFMDHMMPEMDGIETVAKIQSISRHVPIVALTAHALRGMREIYIKSGFVDYLTKPLSMRSLDGILKKWIPESAYYLPLISDDNIAPVKNQDIVTNAQLIDKLNHFRVSFESDHNIDSELFMRFVTFVDSLGTGAVDLEAGEKARQIVEAGKNEDLHEIRKALPAFCELVRNSMRGCIDIENAIASDYGEFLYSDTPEKILPELKKALLTGDINTSVIMLKELEAARPDPAGRELFRLLSDFLSEGKIDRAIDALFFWERFDK